MKSSLERKLTFDYQVISALLSFTLLKNFYFLIKTKDPKLCRELDALKV